MILQFSTGLWLLSYYVVFVLCHLVILPSYWIPTPLGIVLSFTQRSNSGNSCQPYSMRAIWLWVKAVIDWIRDFVMTPLVRCLPSVSSVPSAILTTSCFYHSSRSFAASSSPANQLQVPTTVFTRIVGLPRDDQPMVSDESDRSLHFFGPGYDIVRENW